MSKKSLMLVLGGSSPARMDGLGLGADAAWLFVGTTQGLYRFNGISFEHYQPEEGTFPSRSIRSLFTDRTGGLWIGYVKGGASYLKNSRQGGRVCSGNLRNSVAVGSYPLPLHPRVSVRET